MIVGVAVVPTTPLVLTGLPGRHHPEIAALGTAARRATQALAEADVVIALAGGVNLALSDPPDTDLSGYGLADLPEHDLTPGPHAVVAELHGSLGRDPGTDEALGPDLAVLARHVPAGAACVGVTVPAGTHPELARALGGAIVDLAAQTAVAVLAAGDLSAGHGPKPPRPEAAGVADTVDGLVVAALDGGRPADLIRLDLALAASSAARAVGALRVLGAVLVGARIGTIVRATGAPLGVGYVIAQGG
ncbi:MAG TPA: hypothetical protein VMM13_15430 [Euzebya sp.]|nr:hypothetical protein [Euzebya sp.]